MAVILAAILFRIYRRLLVTLLISISLHDAVFEASLLLMRRGGGEEMYKIRFVAPPPIMKKSFDLAKRPEMSQVQMEFLMATAAPPKVRDVSSLTDLSTTGADLLGVVSPTVRDVMGAYSGAKPAEMAFEVAGAVDLTEVATPQQEAVNLETELLSTKDLDTGRYNAIIIQDPENKRNIRGFFNMTLVTYNFQNPDVDVYPLAIPELLRYLNDYTSLRARIDGQKIELSDPRLFDAPFIYITGYKAVMDMTDTEVKNLGDYLRAGGFLFADDIAPNLDASGNIGGDQANPQRGLKGTAFDQQMKAILRRALGAEGKFYRISKDHPLFHSFYDFDDGPPLGGATQYGNVTDLEGIDIRGRLAVVFSDLNISWYWGDQGATGRERGLQFGVNLIVYALTQPGGIANISEYTAE